MSWGLKNIYLTTAFFLCTLIGYPVKSIHFKMIFMGLGSSYVPTASNDLASLHILNTKTLLELNEIGIIALASKFMSWGMNRWYLALSQCCISSDIVGLMINLLNPTWNSSISFDSKGSWSSYNLLILKWLTESLDSCSWSVETTR